MKFAGDTLKAILEGMPDRDRRAFLVWIGDKVEEARDILTLYEIGAYNHFFGFDRHRAQCGFP